MRLRQFSTVSGGARLLAACSLCRLDLYVLECSFCLQHVWWARARYGEAAQPGSCSEQSTCQMRETRAGLAA